MNDVLMEKFELDTRRRFEVPLQNVRRLVSNKRKSRKRMPERKALISTDTDSDSDEEITLLDVRRMRKDPGETIQNHSLRKIKKPVNKHLRNGDFSDKKVVDPFQNCDICFYDIQSGDTLESVAIKYQCSVADIKRANNLLSNQEFYALKRLKIPVKKHSLLTEILSSSANAKPDSIIIEHPNDNVHTINIGIGTSGRSPSPQDSAAFFKRMDQDLVNIMLSTNSQKDSLEAAAAALTMPQIQPLVKDPYNTVDCGIQGNYLIIFVIILVVVVPSLVALYYVYMRTYHEQHHHTYPSGSSNDPQRQM
ncbi:hypothetical protein JTE90_027551 [Oedothorax gibbosus]|uniref:LysM domain-containing protein n=1 Tax=Oedothorax gibbosus TaxID=931172 RepID=A0AAV6VLD5_9ARAC|nr:hypothetical protein JTE90_027551 [Oedothorax gibbosus]